MSRELDELLALTATRARPGRPGRGRIREHGGPPGGCPDGGPPASGIRPGADNAAAIRDLRDWWLERHPEAGPHYLALRCWGLLIWQPIYLGMIAAHRSAIAPDLAGSTSRSSTASSAATASVATTRCAAACGNAWTPSPPSCGRSAPRSTAS